VNDRKVRQSAEAVKAPRGALHRATRSRKRLWRIAFGMQSRAVRARRKRLLSYARSTVRRWAGRCARSWRPWASTYGKGLLCRAVSDGETRTRAGDTTIFSRAAPSSTFGRFAGIFAGQRSGGGSGPFPHFALVSWAKRHTVVLVCLFVGWTNSCAWPRLLGAHVERGRDDTGCLELCGHGFALGCRARRERGDAARWRSPSMVRGFRVPVGRSGGWPTEPICSGSVRRRESGHAVDCDRLRASFGTACSIRAVWGRPVASALGESASTGLWQRACGSTRFPRGAR
jgi:hypothetical protein